MARSIVVKLPFDEPETSIAPSDQAGGLEDLTGDATSTPALAVAPVVDSAFGKSREFGTDLGFIADDIDDASALNRSVSFQCLITWDHTAQTARATDGTLFARGLQGSAAERFMLGFSIAPSGANAVLKAFWQDTTGTDAVVPDSDAFAAPEADQPFLITIVREWVSVSIVRVSYYVNETFLGEKTSTDGIIGGDGTGTVSVGARGDGAGNYENFLDAEIHSAILVDAPLVIEDVENTYRRIFVWQPEGYSMIKDLFPEGPWPTDPDSRVQKNFRVYGSAIGSAYATQREITHTALPDRATDLLEDWEREAGFSPGPLDSIQTRRNRILSARQTVEGFNVDKIPAALADVLGLTAAQVEIIEGTNYRTSDLSALPGFMNEVDNGSHAAAFAYGSGRLRITADAGGASKVSWAHDTCPYLRQSIGRDELDETDPATGADVEVKIFADTTANTGDIVGLIVYDSVTRGALILGVYNDGTGSRKTGYAVYTAGVGWSAFTSIVTAAAPYWVRLRYDGSGDFSAFAAASGPGVVSNETAIAATGIAPTYCGPIALNLLSTTAADIIGDFDNWITHFPKDLAPFCWAVYRDPALGGDYDLAAARIIVDNMSPAHTAGCAVDNRDQIAGDGGSLIGCALLKGSTL